MSYTIHAGFTTLLVARTIQKRTLTHTINAFYDNLKEAKG